MAGSKQKIKRLIANNVDARLGDGCLSFRAFSLIVVDWLGRDRHIAMIGGRGIVLTSPYV
jgi:hypothetical protein